MVASAPLDPKGYFAILQVTPNASNALIKSAFRHRAMELHPDRNKAPNATATFQLLNLAYSQLSNAKLRAAYDAQSAASSIATNPATGSAATPVPAPEPIVCSVCSEITAQPRYLLFWEIKSFLVVTHRSPIEGIFSPICAEKKILRATATTWVLGWWGFPWGPIYSVHAILNNLMGGKKPPLANARILTYQAIAFATCGKKLSEHLMKVDNNQITPPTIGQCTGGTSTYTDSLGTHPITYSGAGGANFPIQ